MFSEELILISDVEFNKNDGEDQTSLTEGRWEKEEHLNFLNAIMKYGKDWKKVQDEVGSRTGTQIRSHAQKYFMKIKKVVKDRKKIKGKKIPDVTQTQLQLKQLFMSNNTLTINTPKQIIDLLNIEKLGIKKMLYQSCCSQSQISKLKELLSIKDSIKTNNINKKKQQQIFDNKIQLVVKDEVDQKYSDESYYMWLIRRNHEHFVNGGLFTALIDYGRQFKEKLYSFQKETSYKRKISFIPIVIVKNQ